MYVYLKHGPCSQKCLYNIHLIANTSFNISSDPMVYVKEDALLAAERMNIKYLSTEKGLYIKK